MKASPKNQASWPIAIAARQILPNTLFSFSEDLRILYVLQGAVSVQFTSGALPLSAGDVEVINIGEPVCLSSDCDNAVLFFTVDGAFAKSRYAKIDRMIFNCNFNFIFPSQVAPEKLADLKSALESLLRLFLDNDPAVTERTESLLARLMADFNSISNVLNNIPHEEIHKERLNSINTYIMENLDQKIRLTDLANQEYVSLQYLSKEFRERYGVSFSELLGYYRVIRSVRLLVHSQFSIAEISELCGFSAPRYYYKYFKKFLKVSPGEFRKELLSRQANQLVSQELDLAACWKSYRSGSSSIQRAAIPAMRLLLAVPSLSEHAREELLARLQAQFQDARLEVAPVPADRPGAAGLYLQERGKWRFTESLVKRESGFDGFFLAGIPPETAGLVRSAVTIPAVCLEEAAPLYFQLSGIPYGLLAPCGVPLPTPSLLETRLCYAQQEDPAQTMQEILRRLSQLRRGLPQVLLLTDPELVPFRQKIQISAAVHVTDGVPEASLILKALLRPGWKERKALLRSSGV